MKVREEDLIHIYMSVQHHFIRLLDYFTFIVLFIR